VRCCYDGNDADVDDVLQVMRPAATSVLDVLTSDSEYSFLVELINIAGLSDLLQQNRQPITFFAPTNQVSCRSPSPLR